MKTDTYTKAVLTVIAIALTVIAVRGIGPGSAIAQGSGCGNFDNPCYVATAQDRGQRVNF